METIKTIDTKKTVRSRVDIRWLEYVATPKNVHVSLIPLISPPPWKGRAPALRCYDAILGHFRVPPIVGYTVGTLPVNSHF
jgi:hypothetical protein